MGIIPYWMSWWQLGCIVGRHCVHWKRASAGGTVLDTPLNVMVAIGVHHRWALHQLCKVIWFVTSCVNLLHKQTKNFGKRLVNLDIAGHSSVMLHADLLQLVNPEIVGYSVCRFAAHY